jgi:hypothetical protein
VKDETLGYLTDVDGVAFLVPSRFNYGHDCDSAPTRCDRELLKEGLSFLVPEQIRIWHDALFELVKKLKFQGELPKTQNCFCRVNGQFGSFDKQVWILLGPRPEIVSLHPDLESVNEQVDLIFVHVSDGQHILDGLESVETKLVRVALLQKFEICSFTYCLGDTFPF